MVGGVPPVQFVCAQQTVTLVTLWCSKCSIPLPNVTLSNTELVTSA